MIYCVKHTDKGSSTKCNDEINKNTFKSNIPAQALHQLVSGTWVCEIPCATWDLLLFSPQLLATAAKATPCEGETNL
jgi:hypothetical protein